MARTSSALLWRLGEGLSDPVPDAIFSENPATWIEANIAIISRILEDDEIRCNIFSEEQVKHIGLERLLFPRLAAYIYARLKLFDDDSSSRRLTEFLQSSFQWSTMDDVMQLINNQEMTKNLVGYVSGGPKLMFWERGLLVDLHRLDLTCLMARVHIICADIQRCSLDDSALPDIHHFLNILRALRDHEHFKTARPTIVEALSTLAGESELDPDKSGPMSSLPIEHNSPTLDIISLLPASQPAPTLLNEGELLEDLTGEDIVIAIMGPSGTGKSSFINKLLGTEVAQSSSGLQSCTQQVHAYGCFHPNRSNQRIIVVDTPGFDDTRRTDYAVLEDIAKWLEKTYKRRVMLSGVLQFHSIRESKMRRTPLRNLEMFKRLCGSEALKNVILLTTFWDVESERVGSAREKQLREEFWAPLMQKGSQIDRFDPPTFERAWNIVDHFPPTSTTLALQIELVEQRKKLWETSVFKFLVDWWNQFVKAIKETKKHSTGLDPNVALRQKEALESASSMSSLDVAPKWFRQRRMRQKGKK